MNTDWISWQLCDSAFPAGALAHSAGLEAAWQHGEVAGAEALFDWTSSALRNAGRGAVPVVGAAWSGDVPLAEVDALCDAFLLNHVANGASRSMGQALLMACVRAFDSDAVREVRERVGGHGLAGHYAPVFGALGQALGLSRRRTCELFLFLTLRGVMSSAVRLGIVGPLQAQGLQHRLAARLAEWAGEWMELNLDDLAQTAPLADLMQATQERLYSRLFVS
jgi:urease accessory protein